MGDLDLRHEELFRTSAFIGGRFLDSISGSTFEVLNPATQQVVAMVADCGQDDAWLAIKAAHEAFGPWSRELAKTRSVLLRRWFDLIIEHSEDLALILTTEQGKPLAEARSEVSYGASFVEWYSEECKRVRGEVLEPFREASQPVVLKQPVGVVAAITPWNFPVAMITRKIAPALAAGCSVVLKPAESTPLCALALCQLAVQAGFPEGLINVLPTSAPAPIGEAFTQSNVVRKLSFTGSTAVGKALLAQAAPTVKKLALELGGNAPFIVFDDADIDQAVAGAMASKFRNSGQTCVCANRVLVQAGVLKEFVDKLSSRVTNLKVGAGFEPGVEIGPLINQAAINKARVLVDEALQLGARVVAQAKTPGRGNTDGFYAPLVLSGVSEEMAIANTEIFAPVAPVMCFKTEDEAIRLANSTPYGLAAYFYSGSPSRIWRVARALEFGMVGVNEGAMATETAPFGGVKESGIGREGSHQGIDEFLEDKYVLFGLTEPSPNSERPY